MSIPNIDINNIDIGDIDVNPITVRIPPPAPVYRSLPVTVDIGVPIVDMPGCVEAHEQNTKKEKSGILGDDDPKGVKVYCDAGVPSFNPMDYNKDDLEFQRETPVPPVAPPAERKTPDPIAKTPNTKDVIPKIECPTQKQLSEEPVGFIFDGGRKEVTGYKLVNNQCIREVRDVPIIEQAINGLPPTGTVITTGGIAVVATTSALLAKPFADILLKVIKPTVKKVLKKVASIRGKQMKILSVKERRAEQRDRNQAIAKIRAVRAKTKK